MWVFSLFSKSHIDHVNHGNLKIYGSVGVSSTFLSVMRCSYYFFVVLQYSEPPNAPLLFPSHLCLLCTLASNPALQTPCYCYRQLSWSWHVDPLNPISGFVFSFPSLFSFFFGVEGNRFCLPPSPLQNFKRIIQSYDNET